VLPVFDSPVVACIDGEVAGAGQVFGQAGDAVGDLFVRPGATGGAAVAADAQDLGGVRPAEAGGGGGADAAPFAAAVSFALFGPGGTGEVRVRAGQRLRDGGQQPGLVALEPRPDPPPGRRSGNPVKPGTTPIADTTARTRTTTSLRRKSQTRRGRGYYRLPEVLAFRVSLPPRSRRRSGSVG
jgi:hypothetical protein